MHGWGIVCAIDNYMLGSGITWAKINTPIIQLQDTDPVYSRMIDCSMITVYSKQQYCNHSISGETDPICNRMIDCSMITIYSKQQWYAETNERT